MAYKIIEKNYVSKDGTWCENYSGCPYRIVYGGCALYHQYMKEGKPFNCDWFALDARANVATNN